MTNEPNSRQSGGPLLPQRSILGLHKIPTAPDPQSPSINHSSAVDDPTGSPLSEKMSPGLAILEPGSKGISRKPSLSSASKQQTSHPTQEAATNIIRSQIDNLFSTQNTSNQIENISPYQQTHTEHPTPQADQWKEYHSAWQDYYQKYYEGYYAHHLKYAQYTLREQLADSRRSSNPSYIHKQSKNQSNSEETPSSEEVIFDLRQKLITKVRASATKVRKSRHFIPIIAGLSVVLIFAFLQYNRVLIANVVAYVSPGNIDPQNIVIDPSSNVVVGPSPKLIIPKINVDVPVIYDIGNDYNSQMAAMVNGVAHFAVPGASSHPGQIGNTVIAGHSSNDLLDTGDYKFIFAQLDKLVIGDTIYANYNSIRYTYTVTGKEIVKPTEINRLVYPTAKPILTLLTCTPLGTSINRLLVIAEQVSPDPSQSTTAPVTTDSQSKSIPGSSPTLFERLFGGNK